jgi:hypothetical protein
MYWLPKTISHIRHLGYVCTTFDPDSQNFFKNHNLLGIDGLPCLTLVTTLCCNGFDVRIILVTNRI